MGTFRLSLFSSLFLVLFVLAIAPAEAIIINHAAQASLQWTPSLGVTVDTGVPQVYMRWGTPATVGGVQPLIAEYRGIIEYDISSISPIPNTEVLLYMGDGGGSVSWAVTTNIYWYYANGTAEESDWDIQSEYYTSITRDYIEADPTVLDITAIINQFDFTNYSFIGFRFEAQPLEPPNETSTVLDSFPNHYIDYNGLSAPVPEPATLLLFGSGLLGLVGLKKKFKKNR